MYIYIYIYNCVCVYGLCGLTACVCITGVQFTHYPLKVFVYLYIYSIYIHI